LRRVVLALAAVLALAGICAFAVVQTQPAWYLRARYPLAYGSILRAHAATYGFDPALLAAVVETESKFDAETRSPAGAVGLMQLLPATAQGIADRTGGGGFTAADLTDPEINVRYGCWYLRHLRQRYAAQRNPLDLALAAYNAGQANADRWVAATPRGAVVRIGFPETRAYIARIHRLQHIYEKAYGL
jgi:soluble lytic murein transglycosylase